MTLILSNLAAWGYGLAALAYLALTVMILTSWRQRSQAYLLLTATLLTALWAGIEAASSYYESLLTLGLALEICRNASWLALLFYILRLRIASTPVHVRVLQSFAGVLVVGLLLLLILPWGFPDIALGKWLLPTGLVALTVLGLVAVEQVYRSTRAEDRWAIKFLCLGLGGLFIFDFYLYANGALFRSLNLEIWSARGFVVTLIAPLIAVSAARNPQWSVPVGLSRNMAIFSNSSVDSETLPVGGVASSAFCKMWPIARVRRSLSARTFKPESGKCSSGCNLKARLLAAASLSTSVRETGLTVSFASPRRNCANTLFIRVTAFSMVSSMSD